MKKRIRCINKSVRTSPYARIKSIGGINDDGIRWKLSIEEAIQAIESSKWQFYVEVAGMSVDVILSSQYGYKYIKTTTDGEFPNNLLCLPECPL